eukprot:1159260-Pelagomonas_calceolata.AAC.3
MLSASKQVCKACAKYAPICQIYGSEGQRAQSLQTVKRFSGARNTAATRMLKEPPLVILETLHISRLQANTRKLTRMHVRSLACACTHAHTSTHVHTYAHTRAHTRTNAHTHAHAHAHTRAHTHAHLHKAWHGSVLHQAIKYWLNEVSDPALQAPQVHAPGLHAGSDGTLLHVGNTGMGVHCSLRRSVHLQEISCHSRAWLRAGQGMQQSGEWSSQCSCGSQARRLSYRKLLMVEQ